MRIENATCKACGCHLLCIRQRREDYKVAFRCPNDCDLQEAGIEGEVRIDPPPGATLEEIEGGQV